MANEARGNKEEGMGYEINHQEDTSGDNLSTQEAIHEKNANFTFNC